MNDITDEEILVLPPLTTVGPPPAPDVAESPDLVVLSHLRWP